MSQSTGPGYDSPLSPAPWQYCMLYQPLSAPPPPWAASQSDWATDSNKIQRACFRASGPTPSTASLQTLGKTHWEAYWLLLFVSMGFLRKNLRVDCALHSPPPPTSPLLPTCKLSFVWREAGRKGGQVPFSLRCFSQES